MISVHRKRNNPSLKRVLCINPQCDDELKPKVGMIFDDIGSVLDFYRTYSHDVEFGVCLGQQKVIDNVLQWKRFLNAKESFRPEKDNLQLMMQHF